MIAERVESFTVGGPLLTDVGGTIPIAVLATPVASKPTAGDAP